MNKFKYMLAAAIVGVSLTACDDDDDYGVLDGIGMVNRSVSIQDGALLRPSSTSQVTLTYNNLVGIDPSVPVTLNGQTVTPVVNPDNGMELIIPLNLAYGLDYTLEVPQGAVYRSDDKSVIAESKTITFSTKVGIDKSLVATSLSNANASVQAKEVYNLLLANYGEKQISGAMGEVAWGLGFTNLVAQEAGKTPAIVGFDYIHLASSPCNWIDYADITPVQTVWNNGGIPAMTWHWNVPKSEVKTVATVWEGDVAMPGDWSGNVMVVPAPEDESQKEEGQNYFDFSGVQVGQSLKITTSNVAAGAQGSIKGNDWAEITPGSEYFDITGDYTWVIDADMLAKLQAGGLIISGHDYNVTGIYIAEGDSSLGGYSCDNTTFSPSKIFEEGSWENGIYKADVEKLAGYLTILRDAGIPVLWRPFHEAAGDYKDGGESGAWFWWGREGVEVTKQLWIKLYNDLTNVYGLNNLIWVWTVQTTHNYVLASVDDVKSSYPGDKYVDILCADLYEDPFTNHTDKFDLVNATADRTKIVALGEIGNMLDIDGAKADNALWSYFMGWYEQDDNGPAFKSWNLNGEWQTALSNPLILNQGDLNF